jgi:glucose 1-dehydrogenase
MRFTGRSVMITGAGGRIGAATARLVAGEGGTVVLLDRAASAVEDVAAEIRAGGGQALAVRADVTQEADVDAAVDRTVAAFGRLDVMVVNAGIQLHRRDLPVHEQSLDAWDATNDVNYRGASSAAGRLLSRWWLSAAAIS